MPLALLWFVFAIGVGASAASKDRSFWVWFILACIFSPLLAWLLLKVMSGN